ncbi:MAG: hypothetical protein IT445_11195 [Phycisphaeraceae bacterium]|nr:hypothetical protein [Phycisphaeraceae bacterium]
MSSWSCPHLRERTDHCERLHTSCVPGRPGCILPQNLQYAVPPQQRLKQLEKASASQTPVRED